MSLLTVALRVLYGSLILKAKLKGIGSLQRQTVELYRTLNRAYNLITITLKSTLPYIR